MATNGNGNGNNGFLIFLITLILVGVAFAVWKLWFQPPTEKQPNQTGCTLEAKICPDGSAVYRTGANCEFTACPTQTTPPPGY